MQLDLLLVNATVRTMDPARPRASSLGVHGGRIVVLDDPGVPAAETVDLGGATVLPGFVDAHCHTAWFGLGLAEVDLSGCTSLDRLYGALERGMAAKPRDEEWLMATGFYPATVGGALPDIDVLDRITGSTPLFVRHTSGHAAVVNSEALRRAGVLSPGTPDPVGGRVVRDDAGRATGLVEETAQAMVQELFRPYPLGRIVAALDRATARYAAEGITTFAEAGIGGGWIGHHPAELQAYQRAREEGALHARAQVMPVLDVLHEIGGLGDGSARGLDLGLRTGFGDDELVLGPVKVFVDGSLLGETAAVTEAFCGSGHSTGYFQENPEQMAAAIREAYRAGWSVAAHAIGDRAIDFAIDVITGCQDAHGRRRFPNRIEHASITRPDQLPRLAAAGICVTPQIGFLRPMAAQFRRLLGPRRTDWTYRGRSFLDAGVRIAGSSDRPVADGAVLRSVQAWTDRLDGDGRRFGPAAERLDVMQALAAYTSEAAAALGMSDRIGSLAVGKQADLVVLEEDPVEVHRRGESVEHIGVRATWRGGRPTHRAG
ncbi:amidohydrolase family protein [Kocuria sediminis]|uniref:Amidohydrolase family protein n=1 Tax=Kocuria sediminis TaxID=1038857 RepID=A0A6N8GNN0_9MICC|nr:amidohydrolase [Kocuria sediminis]MUN64726.1 amidohydrolase family protein [Kocuria sediminis]